MADQDATEFEYRHLTREEQRSVVKDELRKLERSHIGAIVNADLNEQQAKLVRQQSGKPGDKVYDKALEAEAKKLESAVKRLRREAASFGAARDALETRYSEVLEAEDI